MQKLYFLIIGCVALLLIGGVGFLVLHKNGSPSGVLSANNSSQNVPDQRFEGAPAGRGFRDLPAGTKPIFGQITGIADNKLTVQGMSGDLSVIINESTKYTGGTKSDLKIDDRIFGYGIANSDGSITAQQVTINPSFPNRGQNSGMGSPSGSTQSL